MHSRVVAALLASLVATACVTVPEFQALGRDVARLKASGGGASGERLAELGSEIDSLHREVAALRGDLEETRHAAEEARADARALRDQLAQSPPPGTSGDLPDRPPAGPAAPVSVSSGEVRAYEEAFRLYRAADYQAAVDRFRSFLQTHPSSDYADNALFWIGECYLKLDDHERAVLAFEDVTKKYPTGNKVPDALYRQGVALMEIGKKSGQEDTYNAAAGQIFERITTDFPQSERVAEAQRQLEKLGR